MKNYFRTILIGGDAARKAATRIAEFDYLVGNELSVSSFVNPSSSAHFQLVNCGYQWHDVPVFENLAQAINYDGDVNTVSIHYNAKHVLYWVQEVIKCEQIKNLVILAEDVPERDAREIISLKKQSGINILGPSSLGMIIPGKGRVGEIGGDFKNLQLCKLDIAGPVGLITKSGGMSGELMWVISQNSPGLSGVFQIGGDAFPATDFVHWLEYFSHDKNTKVVVMSGEAGGDLEERAAEWYKEYVHSSSFMAHGKTKKNSTMNYEQFAMNQPFKLVAVISGKFLEQMPKGQKFGHAGAKQEESGFGSAAQKIKVLKEAGVEVVEFEKLGTRLHGLFTD